MNRTHPLLLVSLVMLAGCAPSPGPDPVLEGRLRDLLAGFDGRAAVFVHHIASGRTAAVDADSVFPTASMIKVPILAATFQAIEDGQLDYHQQLIYRDSLLYPGEDILGSFADSAVIPLDQVAMLMITTSDNTAALWLQHLCGTGTAINDWLADNGFSRTRMNSRTPGREANWERYGWGQSTPREMAGLLEMIRDGRAVGQAASEEMYRLLTRIYWNDEALSQLPPTVQAASKQGAVSAARSEVVLVNAPGGDYVFAVMTDGQSDTSWGHDNEGYVLIRRVSRLLWHYFEPDHEWQPAEGMERYWAE